MGFVGKLLLHVSAVVLLLVGATTAKSGTTQRDGGIVKGRSGAETKKSDLYVEFISATEKPYTEQSVVSGIRRMIVTMRPDRMQQLSDFARDIRDLGLSPDTEIKAVETVLTTIEQLSDSTISEREAAKLTGQIVDQFVTPGKLAQASTLAGDSAAQGTGSPGSQARPERNRSSQKVQLAQAGLMASEKLEVFRPILAPEELETVFELAAGEVDTADAYHL